MQRNKSSEDCDLFSETMADVSFLNGNPVCRVIDAYNYLWYHAMDRSYFITVLQLPSKALSMSDPKQVSTLFPIYVYFSLP